MKLKDAEGVKVTIKYELEWNKEDIEGFMDEKKSDDAICDDIIRETEKEVVTGTGSQDYEIVGWNGTHWESIDDE